MAGPVQREMEELLQHAFIPTRLAVINDSAKHHGHAGDDGSGESHFTVVIESAAFTGQERGSSASEWSTARWATFRASGSMRWRSRPRRPERSR